MKVKNLIEELKWYDPEDEICAVVWCVDDVKCQADCDSVELTDEQCVDILQSMDADHDATIGINWDVISFHIEGKLK
jgi:hypothetical protein